MEEKLVYERKAKSKGYSAIFGVDEAGRGPLAGPVVAAACHLSDKVSIEGIDDSKKLTPARRKRIYESLISDAKAAYGIGIVDADVIDQVNILQATKLAMKKAIASTPLKPEFLLVDGLHLSDISIPCEKIVKGDSLSLFIAAASILAKVTRDLMMDEYHEMWPEYGFGQHRGYGTKKHMEALEMYGPCPIHRKTFEPIKSKFMAKWN